MPIVGFSVESINAERKRIEERIEKVDINSTPKIYKVEESNLDFLEKSALTISFEFTTQYTPDIGSIRIKGSVVYISKDYKKILKEWEKNRRLPLDVDIEIKNFLLRKCLALGVNITEELNLPPPLAFPIISKKEKEESKYIG